MEVTLDQLHEGQSAKIRSLELHGAMRRRLLDFGMIEGTSIACIRKSPSGSPILYRLRGTLLAIRTAEGRCIRVEAEP